MILRPLRKSELPKCTPYGRLFHEEFRLAGRFVPSIWLRNWQTFMERYDGTIFGLWKGEQFIGGLGAIIVPDLSDGRLCAQEMFLFIDPLERTGTGLLKLLRAFHAWADEKGIECRLVHMHGGTHEAQLKRIYEKCGYVEVETCYRKPPNARPALGTKTLSALMHDTLSMEEKVCQS